MNDDRDNSPQEIHAAERAVAVSSLEAALPIAASEPVAEPVSHAPLHKWINWLLAAELVGAVFVAYQPAWHGELIFDDDFSVLDNAVAKPGSLANIWVPGKCVR